MKATSPSLLEELTARLVTEFRPERIILFGSRVWGNPTADSDVDLLVIVPSSDESPVRRAQRAQRCLGNLRVSTEVLVKTRAEADRLSRVATSLVSRVLAEGEVVYG
jgi:predicted nucleotidyltransferase